ACKGHQQRRIERRAVDSWSFAVYAPVNGPFGAGRSARVKMKVGAVSGNTTLTADNPFFKSAHVGALFRLFNSGYSVSAKLADEDAYSDTIRVTGSIAGDRDFQWAIAGTWAGTVTIQRSFDGPTQGFRKWSTYAYTANSSANGS